MGGANNPSLAKPPATQAAVDPSSVTTPRIDRIQSLDPLSIMKQQDVSFLDSSAETPPMATMSTMPKLDIPIPAPMKPLERIPAAALNPSSAVNLVDMSADDGFDEFKNKLDIESGMELENLRSKINPKDYDTKLTPDEETQFTAWKKQYAPNDSGEDYDLRGAFKKGLTPAQNGHWDDAFKKPNHPTFSTFSNYAKDHPELAGTWEGDQYRPPVFMTKMKKLDLKVPGPMKKLKLKGAVK